MNLAELSVKNLETGERVNYIFEGKEFTNVQMDRAARKLGNALLKLGVKRGDRVILQMPNCPEILQAFQATWKIGAIVVPINYMVGEDETGYIYMDSGARVVISAPEYLPKVKSARARAPELKHIIMLGTETPEGMLSFSKLVAEASDELDYVKTEDSELAALVYTSGTTGHPKGVMHTHYGLFYTATKLKETVQYPPDLVNVAVLPLCHSYGIGTMIYALMRPYGKTVVMRAFNLEQLFANIQKYRINSLALVPTMYVYMLNYANADKYDLSSVDYWICGSAPLAVETWNRFKEKFGGEIAEGWGLTEAAANDSLNPIRGLKKVGSIGKPMVDMEMKIFDENDRALPQGQEGEIVLRGPMVMKGYWGKPEETAEVIKNGWLHTGDIGYVDGDGYFFITDRKKDIIIKGGENISPRSIEEVLYQHPKISEAAVIGIKDPVYGEDVKAFVTLKPGSEVTVKDLMDYCKANLKSFRVPKEIVIMPGLPKNLVGKILKKELRKL
jgi:long-chain acyl-CoA synthetase